MRGTRLWIVALTALLLYTGHTPATAQERTVLAVADFADDGADGRLIQASRLSTYLLQRLQVLGGERLQVVSGDAVRAAMHDQGVTPSDLLRRSRAAALATAVGASRIVVGSWRTLSVSSAPDDPSATPRGSERMATAIFNAWVVDAASGAVVFQASYVGRASGMPIRLALLHAARDALNQAAGAIAQIR